MSDLPVVLLGERRFTVQWQWLTATQVAGISSVAISSNNQIVVACRIAPHIRVYDADAKLVHAFSVEGMLCPHHLSFDCEERLWITDLDGHQVVAVDLQGNIILSLGDRSMPQWQAPFNHPTHALFVHNELWVSDGYGNACIHRYDNKFALQQSFGELGQGEGQFSVPHMLAHHQNYVYVADRENSRVQVLDVDSGQFLFAFNRMYKPMSIATYLDKGLLVSDQTAALSMFSFDGQLLGRCRVNAVYGHGLAVDQLGHIYISTMIPDGLARLSPVS